MAVFGGEGNRFTVRDKQVRRRFRQLRAARLRKVIDSATIPATHPDALVLPALAA